MATPPCGRPSHTTILQYRRRKITVRWQPIAGSSCWAPSTGFRAPIAGAIELFRPPHQLRQPGRGSARGIAHCCLSPLRPRGPSRRRPAGKLHQRAPAVSSRRGSRHVRLLPIAMTIESSLPAISPRAHKALLAVWPTAGGSHHRHQHTHERRDLTAAYRVVTPTPAKWLHGINRTLTKIVGSVATRPMRYSTRSSSIASGRPHRVGPASLRVRTGSDWPGPRGGPNRAVTASFCIFTLAPRRRSNIRGTG